MKIKIKYVTKVIKVSLKISLKNILIKNPTILSHKGQ